MPSLLILCVGGLGSSQLRTVSTGLLWWRKVLPGIMDAVRAVPGVLMFEGSGFNEMNGEGIWDFLNRNVGPPIYLIGHSLGVDTVLHTADSLYGARKVAGMALLAPVWNPKRGLSLMDSNPLVYHPETSIFPDAEVIGTQRKRWVKGTSHNSIAHHTDTLVLPDGSVMVGGVIGEIAADVQRAAGANS